MAVPWLRILDTMLGITDLARGRRPRATPDPSSQLEATPRALGNLETRLAGVVVAALKEAFDRDSRRLELEREQLEAERRRTERALELELLRQAGEREVGRLRLVAGVALASWIGTLFFSPRLMGGGLAPRLALGGGWLLMLAALASAFAAERRIGGALGRIGDLNLTREDLSSGPAGAAASWLVVVGLALVALAVLL